MLTKPTVKRQKKNGAQAKKNEIIKQEDDYSPDPDESDESGETNGTDERQKSEANGKGKKKEENSSRQGRFFYLEIEPFTNEKKYQLWASKLQPQCIKIIGDNPFLDFFRLEKNNPKFGCFISYGVHKTAKVSEKCGFSLENAKVTFFWLMPGFRKAFFDHFKEGKLPFYNSGKLPTHQLEKLHQIKVCPPQPENQETKDTKRKNKNNKKVHTGAESTAPSENHHIIEDFDEEKIETQRLQRLECGKITYIKGKKFIFSILEEKILIEEESYVKKLASVRTVNAKMKILLEFILNEKYLFSEGNFSFSVLFLKKTFLDNYYEEELKKMHEKISQTSQECKKNFSLFLKQKSIN